MDSRQQQIETATASPSDLLARLPGPATSIWPDGQRFIEAISHGSLVVELYAPIGKDPQAAHDRDEVYFVISGSGDFVAGEKRHAFSPGTALFVAAGVAHRFENFSPDFATWVVFYGPQGGERA